MLHRFTSIVHEVVFDIEEADRQIIILGMYVHIYLKHRHMREAVVNI